MNAYKFLRAGAVSPITRFRWPAPNEWVEGHSAARACRAGIHACRPGDLAHWICEELWEIELDGEVVEVVDGLVAPRARLLRPVDAWATRQQDFCRLCVNRALQHVPVAEAASDRTRLFLGSMERGAAAGYTAWCAYASASVVSSLVADLDEAAQRYRDERAVQSRWIHENVLGEAQRATRTSTSRST